MQGLKLDIKDIPSDEAPHQSISEILKRLHREGPVDSQLIEKLSYYKLFHREVFSEFEEKVIFVLGLFYKYREVQPENLYSYVLSGIGKDYQRQYGEYLTPIQASIRRAIEDNQYTSISAPTSAGKSYSIRDYIFKNDGDVVIIVPSRALIAEYVKTMRKTFNDEKNIMISSFVDCVFTSRIDLRRIFILTPERAKDLLTDNFEFNISLFFFDEAQIAEEKNRGMGFDILIRKVSKKYPESKLIFAHPFVENPEAQITKHQLDEDNAYTRSYAHNTVGKIFVHKHSNGNEYYFSPYSKDGYYTKNCIQLMSNFAEHFFSNNYSILIYVTKSSLYNGTFLNEYSKYIDQFNKVDDEKALEIVKQIQNQLGANQNSHRSELVNLLKKGVVIHHGSIPLEVRLLIEDYIREGYARICFATSTLAQGINMPFDVVWLDNNRFLGGSNEERNLAFKNLIGRSGRLSMEKKYDFGYVYTNNAKLLIERLNSSFYLSEKSILENLDREEIPSDDRELIEAILENKFDDNLNLPETKVERLSSDSVIENLKEILDILYKKGEHIDLSGEKNEDSRNFLKEKFKKVYETSLNRSLFEGEHAVFNNAIKLFIYILQGKSFKEIVGMQYSFISKRDEVKKNPGAHAAFHQPANILPDSNLKKYYPIFPSGMLAKNVSYDTIVFDTYDYLDEVISFSLSNVFVGAFSIYFEKTNDKRALKIINFFRYGTSDDKKVWLIRYGFTLEEAGDLVDYIEQINEEHILFKDEICNAASYIKAIVEWYLPD